MNRPKEGSTGQAVVPRPKNSERGQRDCPHPCAWGHWGRLILDGSTEVALERGMKIRSRARRGIQRTQEYDHEKSRVCLEKCRNRGGPCGWPAPGQR